VQVAYQKVSPLNLFIINSLAWAGEMSGGARLARKLGPSGRTCMKTDEMHGLLARGDNLSPMHVRRAWVPCDKVRSEAFRNRCVTAGGHHHSTFPLRMLIEAGGSAYSASLLPVTAEVAAGPAGSAWPLLAAGCHWYCAFPNVIMVTGPAR
jgi:hypothetical protein